MSFESLVESVIERIGSIIQKPRMTEKLLSKPPLRFLHDTISAITVTTGFGEGLYSAEELDFAQITDKQAKINYLDKIINLVGICQGAPLEVKSSKVISGMEPELTNVFLLALANCALDGTIDNAQAVSSCLNGVSPGQIPIPKRGGRAEAKSSDEHRGGSKGVPPPADDVKADFKADLKADIDFTPAPDRGRSRGGTRGGKPTQASVDIGLSRVSAMPNLDPEIERCDGSEATTQALLGEIITKPKLTEKLLAKPPVRFLFDIVMEIIRVTGFASNLYSPEEMTVESINEKSAKLAFLEKITRLVGMQLNTIVEAKPAKIIAGMDAQNTNHFLQLLAVAAKHVPDSSANVRIINDDLNGGGGSGGGDGSGGGPSMEAPVSAAFPAVVEEKRVAEERRPERRPSPAPSAVTAAAIVSEPKEDPDVLRRQQEVIDDKAQAATDGGDSEVKRSARPTTARRRPPKVKEGASEVQAKDITPASKKTEGILIDGQADDDDDDFDAKAGAAMAGGDQRFDGDNDFKGSSNAGSDSRQQSKLVKDILSRQAEQEAARASPVPEEAKAAGSEEGKDAGASSGGIRLGGRLKKGGDRDKRSAPTGSGASGPSSTSTTVTTASGSEQDLDRIRAAIQILVQHTDPLGTCMDFIQEDVGLMTAELHKWMEECRKFEAEMEAEKAKTKAVLQPLRSELAEVEEAICDQVAKVAALKASIMKNDDSILKILKLVATGAK